MDDDELFTAIDSSEFIDRYIDSFVIGFETDDLTVNAFDRMILAADGPIDEVIWAAANGYSKHFVFLQEPPDESQVIDEIQARLQQLNAHATKELIVSFLEYLGETFNSVSELDEHELIEIPDPAAARIGDYPVVNVILFGRPDGQVAQTVEVTYHSAGVAVERTDEVLRRVGGQTPQGDIKEYADAVYDDLVHEHREELNANLVRELSEETLEDAGYSMLKEATVPEDINPLYGDERRRAGRNRSGT